MPISFSSLSGGGSISNDFVVDLNDTTNNVANLSEAKPAGAYSISLSSGDTSFDIYLLDASGNSVGYSNQATIVATAEFSSAVVLGTASDEVLSFTFAGTISNVSSEGDATGAGAYLSSITPTDLPSIDDTATVTGGNFASDVEIYFESGETSTEAKNVTRSDSSTLIITRPDNLDPALDPWDVKAINPGVTPPTGSNAHILAGTVDAGAVPVWSTTSPLAQGTANEAYSATVVAADADGAITYSVSAGSLPAGLTLDSSTGVISGTPTSGGTTFTLAATDDGGNSNTREFTIPIQVAAGGTVTTDGDYTVHTFTSSADFTAFADIENVEFLVIAGGGAGGRGRGQNNGEGGGGGGGGGFRSSIAGEVTAGSAVAESTIGTVTAGTVPVTVGSQGNFNPNTGSGISNSGGSSSFGTYVVSLGGGAGGGFSDLAQNGGSGGGSHANDAFGTGTSGQGFDGGDGNTNQGGQGGSSLQAGGVSLAVNPGVQSSVVNGSPVAFSEGAGGGEGNSRGNDSNNYGSGGGGGGGTYNNSVAFGVAGRPGIVVVRYK